MRRFCLVLLTLLAACGSSGDGAPADNADGGGPSLSVECGLLPLLVETGEPCAWGEASVCNTAGRWNLRAGPEYPLTLKVQNELARERGPEADSNHITCPDPSAGPGDRSCDLDL